MARRFKDYTDKLKKELSPEFIGWAPCSKEVMSTLIQCYKWNITISPIDYGIGFSDPMLKAIFINPDLEKVLLSRQLTTLVHEFQHIAKGKCCLGRDLKRFGKDYYAAVKMMDEAITLEYERKAIKQVAKHLPLDEKSHCLLKLGRPHIVDIINWRSLIQTEEGKDFTYSAYFKKGFNGKEEFVKMLPDLHLVY